MLVCLSACTHRDPQAAYEHAQQTFRHGDAAVAAKEAEEGYNDFHSINTEWAWKFAILRARAFYRQGMYEEALKLLASEPAPSPSGELAVKERWLEGLAYTSLRRFPDAERVFAEAELLCTPRHYLSCGDVASARGTLEMEQGRYAPAQVLFESVLVLARANGDQLWEANALLDLSWSAEKQAHLDEALDWANAARRIAVPRGFDGVAQTALGNMGWAYYRLGDPEKAEGMFIEAMKQAGRLGDVTDQATWLQAIGYIYLDAHKFDAAEESYRRALDLAQHTNREDIINSLIALAFVSEQTSKLDDAKRYADEALAKAREDKNGRDQVYPRLVLGRVAARLHDTTTAENAFREVAQSADCPIFLKWEAERSLARLYENESQFDSADGEYRTALTTFETARSELQHVDSRLPFLTNASHIYDDYIHFLVARGKTTEALQVADFSRARTLKEGLGLLPKGTSFAPEQLNAKQIARHAGGTILFYWLGEEQSYLWAITPQKVGRCYKQFSGPAI